MNEQQEYDWKYGRTNSKGEVIFRHNTDQTVEDVCNFLDEYNIEYEKRLGATMLWIYFKNKKYAYYYTTGKWAPFAARGYPKKHFHSKGIEDFYNRFLLSNKKYVVKETVKDVKEILNKFKIEYTIKNSTVTLITKAIPRVDGKGNRKRFTYEYCIGTGKWREIKSNNTNINYYNSQGIKHFVIKYFQATEKEQLKGFQSYE
tara:strand:+ start:1083 stop:1688 length:606 start_codon:yes stop_codon:yes gene_type:complete